MTGKASRDGDIVYHTGNEGNKHCGVGNVIEKNINAEFSVNSNRVYKIITKIGRKEYERKLTFILSYAQIL